jgi:uncharacterized membrane protein YkvA (DUF1232 family)
MRERWRTRARDLKRLTWALLFAYRDPRTPWLARAVAAVVVAYAFSPIDLIPDIIPVLGYLDDLVLIPLGVLLAVRLIPAPVWADARVRAAEAVRANRPVSWRAATVIVLLWVALAAGTAWLVWRRI